MPFFSTQGDKSGDNIRHVEKLSRKIVVTKYWTRQVRLVEITVWDSTYWLVEVCDLGIRRHSTEYPRGTYEEARKVFDEQTNFRVPAQVSPLRFGTG